jgi:hypothetical protein
MPSQKRNQSDEKYPLKLTTKQRETLVHATRLTRRLKTTTEAAPKDLRFVEFTRKELDKMLGEIDISLDYATHPDQKRLNAVVDKIFDGLADIEEKQMKEKKRQAITKPDAIYQSPLHRRGESVPSRGCGWHLGLCRVSRSNQ